MYTHLIQILVKEVPLHSAQFLLCILFVLQKKKSHEEPFPSLSISLNGC